MNQAPNQNFEVKLDGILARYAELGRAMVEASGEGYATLAKEYAELEPIAAGIQEWRGVVQEATGLREMIADPALDRDMRALAEDELHALERRLPRLERAVKLALLPKDEADDRGAILEIRAGTGGEEAALFAGDLFRMYQRHAELRDWRFEPLSVSDTGRGGIKEVVVAIKGSGVFRKLKFESGVHRVQRVPGDRDLGPHPHLGGHGRGAARGRRGRRQDRRQGPACRRLPLERPRRPVGQHYRQRGAHDPSADRHRGRPAGREVAAQEQGQGAQDPALAPVRAGAHGARGRARRSRKGQVGTGDRSERIRTYNFPQSRCTDHRIALTLYKLDQILAGEALDEMIDALIAEDEAARLAEAV